MATVKQLEWLSPTDYLEGEKDSTVRHEYVDGYVYAMTGASEAHNLIAGNLHAAIHTHLRDKPCRVFINDMKVQVAEANAFYYPDIMVYCDQNDTEAYFKTQPVLIIEVLSSTTERTDRQEKRIAYQTINSLVEYVLIAQDSYAVTIYRRQEHRWPIETLSDDDTLFLQSVDLLIPLGQIYEDVILTIT